MLNGANLDNLVPVGNTITRQIANGPDSLINKTWPVLIQQLNEDGNTTLVNNRLTLRCATGAHICQYPSSLELQLRVKSLFTHFNEKRNELSIDNLLNGRVLID
jgi:hypothetical protein